MKKELNFSEILKLSLESRKEAWTREKGFEQKRGLFPMNFISFLIPYFKIVNEFIQLDI